MAEILIKAIDATHLNPVKNQRGCYKRGDPVVIMPDGWGWGTEETKPPIDGGKFVIIKIPGVTPQQVHDAIHARWPGLQHILESELQAGMVVRRRQLTFNIDLLPSAVKNTLNRTGTYTTTWAAIKSFVRDKVSNTTG